MQHILHKVYNALSLPLSVCFLYKETVFTVVSTPSYPTNRCPHAKTLCVCVCVCVCVCACARSLSS